MRIRNYRRLALPALLLFLVPAVSHAQQQDDERQAWAMELQQIQMQLQPLQERALEDDELREQRDAATAGGRAAMIDIDPEVGASLDRLEAMMDEVEAAQAAGDAERIVALTAEAQQIQPQIARAQAQAVQRDDVREAIGAFQQSLRAHMIRLDPDAEALFNRADDLERRITGG